MNSTSIPTQAYLYKPKELDIKPAYGQRQIFDGNLQLDEKEANAVAQFKAYAARSHYNLKSYWTDNKILRFLQAAAFKNDKALASITAYTNFRETKLPVNMDTKLQNFLNSGFFYVHGRDHKFRPIVVFNINQLDPKNVDMDLITNALTFWFEHIIDEMMLPGQVEQWIFVTNLKGMSIATMAVQSVRKLFSYLQDNYKCRLYKMYLINAPTSVYIPWSICKNFLDGDTVEKVNFHKQEKPVGLFSHTNPSQVEKKLGGTAPNATQFWPPIIPSDDYFVTQSDANNFMTKEEYNKLYKNGGLQGLKVNMALIDEEKPPRGSTQGSLITPGQNTPGESVVMSEGVSSYATLPQNYLDDSDEFTDYVEAMHENHEDDNRASKMKEFSASFISRLEAH